MDSHKNGTNKDQEGERLLTRVELKDKNSNNNNNTKISNQELNISDGYISSDAETEKMSEVPKLEETKENKRSYAVTDIIDKEDGPEMKRLKTDGQAPEVSEGAPIPEIPPADDEGDVDEDIEEEAEEESSETTRDRDKAAVKHLKAGAGVDADAEVEGEEEEEIEEMAEDDEDDDSKRLSTMPSPILLEEQRQMALQEITDIEYKFAELRQRLFENKMLRLKTELQMCLEGSHPRLQTYYQKIASIRDHKLKRAYQRQKYNMQCIDTETKATRTHIHQDFIRKASDLRGKLLTDTTQTWYDINKERREMDIIVPEVNYHVPVKLAGKTLSCITGYAGPAQQRYPGEPLSEDLECENITFRYRSNAVDKLEVIVDRMRLNNELSDLGGLKRYFHSFPGAPNLSGLRDSEIYEDLQHLQNR